MKRWFKCDLRTLTNQIDHFVLFNALYHDGLASRAFVERDRTSIVTAGLRGFRETIADRARNSRETAGHFGKNPGVYGDSTPEMIARFVRLAEEDERAVARLDRISARVEREGLPDEVADYLPSSLKSNLIDE